MNYWIDTNENIVNTLRRAREILGADFGRIKPVNVIVGCNTTNDGTFVTISLSMPDTKPLVVWMYDNHRQPEGWDQRGVEGLQPDCEFIKNTLATFFIDAMRIVNDKDAAEDKEKQEWALKESIDRADLVDKYREKFTE